MELAFNCLSALKIVLIGLIPSFLVPVSWRGSGNSSAAKNPGHAFRYTRLDGLRGLACLSVVLLHTSYAYNGVWDLGDGISYETAKSCGIHISRERYLSRSHLIQLPFVRILYNGQAGVAIFFILSGFVLTQRPLRYARQSEYDRVLKTLSSATFRRPFRLFLPLIIGTFITMILTYLKITNRGLHNDCLIFVHEPPCPVFHNFITQVGHWIRSISLMVDVWKWNLHRMPYDIHLWTISSELRGSFAIFTVTLATCRLRTKFRLFTVCLLIAYCYFWVRWDMCLFLSGMLFVETSAIPSLGRNIIRQSHRIARFAFLQTGLLQLSYYIVLFVSLYLFSVPLSCAAYTPGYSFLYYISPRSLSPNYRDDGFLRLHAVWGAFLFAGVLIHWKSDGLSNPLARFFETPCCQYFGRISYSVYIVHGPLLHLFGYRLLPVIWHITGQRNFIQSGTGWAIGLLIIFTVVIWVADLFTRVVDEPCVRIAKRIEEYVLIKQDGDSCKARDGAETADTGRIRLD